MNQVSKGMEERTGLSINTGTIGSGADLAMSMFNPSMFNKCKENIGELEYYFRTNAQTSGNVLIQEILYAVKNYDYETVDGTLLNSIVLRSGLNEQEAKQVVSNVRNLKGLASDKIKPYSDLVDQIIANSMIRKGMAKFPEDPQAFLRFVNDYSMKSGINKEKYRMVDFNAIDVVAETRDINTGIKSSFDWVNRCFQPLGMYELPGIVLFTAVPGSGKSLWAMSEAIHMAVNGEYVNYLAMGDLTMKDMIWRSCAIYSGLTFGEAKGKLVEIHKGMSMAIGDRLSFTITPSGTLSVEEYLAIIRKKDEELMADGKGKLGVVIIDYDAGFKSDAVDENMYSGYGKIYDAITTLSTVGGKLVIILAQPKVGVWGNEEINLQEVGESSRKQHTADIVISRGKYKESALGIFKVVKNRRGRTTKVYSVRVDGRFVEIPRGVYEQLKSAEDGDEPVQYDLASVNALVSNYKQNEAQVSNRIAAAVQQQQQNKPSPFA